MKKLLLIFAIAALSISTASAQFINDTRTKKNTEETGIRYQGDVEVLFKSIFSGDCNFGVGTTHGVKISPYFFVGAGLQFDYATYDGGPATFLTPYLSLKGYLPLGGDVRLFINPTVGYALGLSGQYYDWSYRWFNPAYDQEQLGKWCDYGGKIDWSVSIGCEYKSFYLAAGVATCASGYQEKEYDTPYPAGFMAKLGYRF